MPAENRRAAGLAETALPHGPPPETHAIARLHVVAEAQRKRAAWYERVRKFALSAIAAAVILHVLCAISVTATGVAILPEPVCLNDEIGSWFDGDPLHHGRAHRARHHLVIEHRQTLRGDAWA